MEISIISFTEQGRILADKLKTVLTDQHVENYWHPEQGLSSWTEEQFAGKRAMIFIGACGIAVRAIAPFIRDKMTDSPVLVLDEKGQFIIPVLSGHLGGANELARLLAELLHATAVITTATDINDRLAVDLFAKKNGLHIMNIDGIAKVSAKLLRGETVIFQIEDCENRAGKDAGAVPEGIELASCSDGKTDVLIASDAGSDAACSRAVLRLKPREYVIGIGCRKGKTEEEIQQFVSEKLQEMGISDSDIAMIASIENKKNEAGICQFAAKTGIPFVTFSREQLQEVNGKFCASAFVENTVGVDNVCERAAMAACMGEGELVLGKQIKEGMTFALAKRIWKIKWEW